MKIIRLFRNLRLRQKLLISYLIVIILPTIALGLYAYQNAKASLRIQLQQTADNSAKQMSMEISYRLQRQETPMKSIVYHPDLVKVLSNGANDTYALFKTMNDKIEPILSNLLYLIGDMKEIMLYAEGRDKEFGNYISPSSSVKDKSWYKLMKNSSGTMWWYEDGKLFATRNLYDPESHVVSGELYVKFNEDKIFGEVLSKEIDGHIVVITDKQKRVIVSENPGYQAEIANQLNHEPETNKMSIDGVSYFVKHNSIPQTDWTLHYLIPAAKFNAGIGNILSATGIIVLLCMVFLSFIIFLFSETLLKSIEKLNVKMKMVEEGDFSIIVSAHSKDEIGQLAARFRSMLLRINQLIDEVYLAKVTQKEAELKALQAQINPHFLYNSLSLINSKALRIDAQEISDLVNQLSKFYRTTLNKGQQIISIRDEWTNVQAYIYIQLAMHNKGFTVEYHIDQQIFEYEMIHLILQPIVENAIIHGIDQKVEGDGVLMLQGYSDGQNIVFVIADNGIGMEEEVRTRLLEQSGSGYGMKNVQERLQLFFGESYGLTVESRSGEGTTVTVRIPQYIQSGTKSPHHFN